MINQHRRDKENGEQGERPGFEPTTNNLKNTRQGC